MVLTTFIFLAGYTLIALEHKVKIDKAAIALLLGVLLWLFLVWDGTHLPDVLADLSVHFEAITEILFFLLGAMTIVELIDTHYGFRVLNQLVKTGSKTKLLWVLSILTFFLSSVLDNLTTTIVMMAVLKRFVHTKADLWFFAGFVIIAANAGGAWSPIGDVTTIMLWNGGQVTSGTIIAEVLLPSLACLLVPLFIASFNFRGQQFEPRTETTVEQFNISQRESNFILLLGMLLLLFVPVFKSLTGLPPVMGMIFSLCIFWLTTDILHRKKASDLRRQLSVAATIQRVDTPSVLFFLGILLAVAAMEVNGSLGVMGRFLGDTFDNFYLINTSLGLLSSVVDNVPLVAGAMGMYSIDVYPQDHDFWSFLAYCAGTGGSALIIGSAAGVAAMGILKIDFLWYLKKISWLALIGYFSGILVYVLIN
jgi:Na+/H+ antiporter NhaD/arsenite permease-like protein